MSRSTTDAAREATKRLGGTWLGSYGLARCPAHADGKPSLSINAGNRAVLYKCFAGCTQDAVMAALRSCGMPSSADAAKHASVPSPDLEQRRRLALDIWDRALPIGGTLAEIYLRRRGIDNFGPARFDPASVTVEVDRDDHRRRLTLPALVLPLHNNAGFRAIQRIFLNREGGKADLESPKKILGRRDGATIRIGQHSGSVINLAEGFEDALSAMALKGLAACWAVCGVENYRHIDLPDDCRRVKIYSQRGKAARKAIEAALPQLTANRRMVEVILPPRGGDWNDALVRAKARADGVAAPR
ncbi:MAG: toprim domain-containing protein [Erythrobacter sp.]